MLIGSPVVRAENPKSKRSPDKRKKDEPNQNPEKSKGLRLEVDGVRKSIQESEARLRI